MAERGILFVHPPLLGPSCWAPIATALGQIVPDLTEFTAGPPPYWNTFASMAASAASSDVECVIGFSGAGPLLPVIADRLEASALIFVDAGVPPEAGTYVADERIKTMVEENSRNGILNPWSKWWPAGTMERLITDQAARSLFEAELPAVPGGLYDESIPMPAGWSNLQCGYLKLSSAYEADLAEARRRGWTNVELELDHLALMTKPTPVIAALREVLGTVTE